MQLDIINVAFALWVSGHWLRIFSFRGMYLYSYMVFVIVFGIRLVLHWNIARLHGLDVITLACAKSGLDDTFFLFVCDD